MYGSFTEAADQAEAEGRDPLVFGSDCGQSSVISSISAPSA